MWEIRVPVAGRKMISANDRLHHMAKAKLVKEWRAVAALAARSRRIPPLSPPVRVVVVVHRASRHRREVSNWFPTFKACIDGFVDAGVLEDDSDDHVIGPDPRRGRVKHLEGVLIFQLSEVDDPNGV